jgi:hypothetical protein
LQRRRSSAAQYHKEAGVNHVRAEGRAFLAKRDPGKLLAYSSSALEADASEIGNLGGIVRNTCSAA